MKIRMSLCVRKCLQSIQCFELVFIIIDNDLCLYGNSDYDSNLVDEIMDENDDACARYLQ